MFTSSRWLNWLYRGWRREGHRVFVLFQDVCGVPPDLLGVMGADADTFAAVNAELPGDHSLSVADTDGLGGAALDAVDASHAQLLI